MKGIVRRKDKILPPSAIAGCLDVLCKAYAQIAPIDAILAGQINEAIETIMDACKSDDELDSTVKPGEKQFKQGPCDIIEDIFTGEVLYRGVK